MFDIIKIELEDFRSFRGKHSFEFPTEPGLYAITGVNLDNPELGPNGVGKSTLLEAIYWCNYGRTTRGLKATDVINWGAKGCAVTVQQLIGGQHLTVTRTQSPNSLMLNGQPVDQTELQVALRIGPEAFTYAVMAPQFGQAFFDLTPSDKLTLFSQIMELDFWLEKSKRASELAEEILIEKSAVEKNAARQNGQLETITDDLRQLAEKEIKFSEDQRSLMASMTGQITEIQTSIKVQGKVLNETKLAIDGLEKRRDKLIAKIDTLLNEKDKFEANHSEIRTQKSVIENRLSAVTATSKRLEGVGAECPTCLQEVDAVHLTTEKQKYKKQYQSISKELEDCIEAFEGASTNKDNIVTAIKSNQKDLETIEQNLEDFRIERNKLSSKSERCEADLRQLRTNIANEQKKPNPYSILIEEKQAQKALLKKAIKQTTEEIDQLAKDNLTVNYWIGGFKKIRLFVIEETLRQLELEINNNLASLGLLTWRVELDVERENKSGGITKGFTVAIQASGNEKPVKFEAWSGGETQRLRLAGDLGLANLIMENAGLRSTIEFFDEPSRHLSQEGMLDLAETLHQRAIDSKKRIFVVEHNLTDYPYTATLPIVKSSDGSYFERV